MRSRQRATLLGLILISIGAGMVARYATTRDVWAGSDSAVFITAARNFIAGIGLRVIQPSGKSATLLGPMYPLLLACLGLIKIPLLVAARWMNIFLFGITTFSFGFIFYRYSYSPWMAIPAAIMAVIFPTMVDMHSGMMTEALYLSTSGLGILLLLARLGDNSRLHLFGAAIFCGLAIITRFIGFALLPVGILALMILQETTWKKRLADTSLFLVISMVPFIAWYVWFRFNPDVSSPLGAPQWSNPVDTLKLLRDSLVNTLWGWVPFQEFIPFRAKIQKYLMLFLLLLVLFSLPLWGAFRMYGRKMKRWIEDKDVRVFSIFFMYCIWYLLTFAFIYLFRTPAQDINDRTLLPLYLPLTGMLFSGFSLLRRGFSSQSRRQALKLLPWLALVLCAAAYVPKSAALASQYHQTGGGFTSATWHDSETLEAVEQLPAELKLISNNSGVIMFYTGRSSLEIEELYRTEPLPRFTRFGDNPDSPTEVLFHDREAALVIWQPSFYWQLYNLYQDKTNERMEAFLDSLEVYAQYSDGALYFYTPQK